MNPSLGTSVTDPAELKILADDRGAIFGPVVPLVKAGDGVAATRLAMDNVNGAARHVRQLSIRLAGDATGQCPHATADVRCTAAPETSLVRSSPNSKCL